MGKEMGTSREEDRGYNQRLEDFRLGTRIAQQYYFFLEKTHLDHTDLNWMSLFLGDYDRDRYSPQRGLSQGNSIIRILEITQKSGGEPRRIDEYLNSNPSEVSMLRNLFRLDFTYVKDHLMDPYVRQTIQGFLKPQAESFDNYSDRFWMQWASGGTSELADAGEVGVLLGAKGSGKTSFALLMAEIFQRNGWSVISNIVTDSQNFQIFSTFSQMVRLILLNAMKNVRTFAMIDELKVGGMRRKRAMAGETMNMEDLSALTRKFGCSMLLIWHYDEDITTEVMKSASFIVTKHGNVRQPRLRGEMLVEFIGNKGSRPYLINRVPNTNLAYETSQISPFVTDIGIRDILKQVNEGEMEGEKGDSLIERIVKYIEDASKQEEKEEIIIDGRGRNPNSLKNLKWVKDTVGNRQSDAPT